MLRIILAGVRAHALRLLLTGVAIALGVSFLTGALIYAETARAGFFDDLARPAANVDVAVRPATEGAAPAGPGTADPALSGAAVAAVRAVPGVAEADARTIGPLALMAPNGRVINNFGRVGVGVAVPAVAGLSMYRLIDGRAPAGTGEAVLDVTTAQVNGYLPGARVTVLDHRDRRHELTVVGLADFGSSARFRYRSVVALAEAQLRGWSGVRGYSEVVVRAGPDVDPAQLRDRVAAALAGPGRPGPKLQVLTGDELRRELATSGAKYTDGFLNTLLAATIVALVVCCLVIYNTFTMLVAQRARELALLRCLGASRGQLLRLVLGESAVVGLVASAAGVALGAGLGWALLTGRDTLGQGLPEHPLVISPTAVVAGLVVGVLATVAASVLPAVAAARVAPLAALRTSAEAPGASRPAWLWRIGGAAVLAAGGLAITRRGLGEGFDGTPKVVAGAMVVFVALVVLVPLFAAPLVAALGWLPGRLFGPTARLAAANARRNPRRVAATTTALMIGVALLSLLAVILETAKQQADRELAENFPIDFVLTAVARTDEKPALPAKLAPDLAARAEFSVVGRARSADAWLAGRRTRVSAVAPQDLGTRLTPEVEAGDLTALRPGTLALRRDPAAAAGQGLGSRVLVQADSGQERTLTVVAIYDDSPAEGDALLHWADFGALNGPAGGERVLVRRADAVTAVAARTTLDAVLRAYPLVYVDSVADWRQSLTLTLQRRLSTFSGLLAMSTVIAVFGIMNTMSLAVLERTRESATLRALGLTRRRLRATFLIEALLMALLAAVVGVVFGVGSGWLAAQALVNTYGHGSPAVPVGLLAAYAALAAVAGALAAVLPSRRAARAGIVAALSDH